MNSIVRALEHLKWDPKRELEGKLPPLSPSFFFTSVLVLLHQAFFFFLNSSVEGDSSNAF
jgi:hypothetical protein